MKWAVVVYEASHIKAQPFRRSSVMQSLSYCEPDVHVGTRA